MAFAFCSSFARATLDSASLRSDCRLASVARACSSWARAPDTERPVPMRFAWAWVSPPRAEASATAAWASAAWACARTLSSSAAAWATRAW